jgi:hypothetical protein
VSAQGASIKVRPLAALLLLAALLVVVGATAAPANAKRLPYPPAFKIEASNGYSMFVFGAPARKGHPSTIAIFLTGKNDEAFYTAPATVTETSFQASLGALGEIAVTFHPSGQARTERSDCGGKPVSFDSGYYEGTIIFHGEEGFTGVEATRAPGDLGLLLNVVCPGISGGRGGPFMPGAELDVDAHNDKFGPHLMVVKNRPKARAHSEVGISEMSNGISIGRFAGLVAPAGTFTYDPKVLTATLSPPAPFSGSAQFHRGAKPANRWSGNLTVDLPGRAGVKLTGGGLKARLAHAHWDWHTSLE